VDGVKKFKPDVILAIGGGGFIPARILRSSLKVPMLGVILALYDDKDNTARKKVDRIQWVDHAAVNGKRVLIVDEVDDTRKTLQYCIEELMRVNKPEALAVAVIHNKLKKKVGKIPDGVAYFAGEEIPDFWTLYPWDADSEDCDIYEHERLARECMEGGDVAEIISKQLILAIVICALAIAVCAKITLISKKCVE